MNTLADLNAAIDAPPAFEVEPVELWDIHSQAPMLTKGILPPILEELAFAEPHVLDPLAVAVSALSACSMAVQGVYSVHVINDWYESLILWVLLMGDPSTLKTPIMRRVIAAMIELQKSKFQTYRVAHAEWVTAGSAADDEPVKPASLYTNDATIEAVSEMVKDHRFGIGLWQDELSSWLADFSEKGSDRKSSGVWLTAWSGGPYMFHRIKRGEGFTPNLSISILGAATTDKLYKMAATIPADGLLARFLPVILPQSMGAVTKSVVNLDKYGARILHLFALRNKDRVIGASGPDAPREKAIILKLEPDAFKVVERIHKENAARAGVHKHTLPRLAEAEGKLTGQTLRIAGLFTALEHPNPALATTISAECLERAVKLVDILRQHALIFYRGLTKFRDGREIVILRAIADYILRLDVQVFQVGDLARHVLPEWREADPRLQHASLEMLAQLGWIQPDDPEYFIGGKLVKGTKYHVNPAAHELYRDRAEMQKQLAKEAAESIKAAAASRRATWK